MRHHLLFCTIIGISKLILHSSSGIRWFKREPDQYMPITNVIRIMRRVLPEHAKISDDAKETIQECVSEFIGFVTTEANKRCHREYRKTVTPDDVLSAMASLGFGPYVGPLAVFLHRHRARGRPELAGRLQMAATYQADEGSYGGGYFVGGGEDETM